MTEEGLRKKRLRVMKYRRENYIDVRVPTEAEKIAMGLVKKPVVKGTIHIVIPEHYGAKGVWWESRFVTEAQLDGYKAQYPDMQILDEKYKIRREEAEDAE